MSLSHCEAHLRAITERIPIESIGLYVEGNVVLWRDCIGGESGVLLEAESAYVAAKKAVRCIDWLRKELATWNWPAQLASELDLRAHEGRDKRERREARRAAA